MRYLPIYLDLTKINCLVVGGGVIAWRKIKLLLKANAKDIKIVANSILSDSLDTAIQSNDNISYVAKEYDEKFLDGISLVILATNNPDLHRDIYTQAISRNILVNAVDQLDSCNLTFPAIVDRSPLIISISSCGQAPVLSRQIKERLDIDFPKSLSRLSDIAGSFRDQLNKMTSDTKLKKLFWEKFFSKHYKDAFLLEKSKPEIHQMMVEQVSKLLDQKNNANAKLIIINTNSDDLDLITLKAVQFIQSVDVIFYDKSINTQVFEYARKEVDLITFDKFDEIVEFMNLNKKKFITVSLLVANNSELHSSKSSLEKAGMELSSVS